MKTKKSFFSFIKEKLFKQKKLDDNFNKTFRQLTDANQNLVLNLSKKSNKYKFLPSLTQLKHINKILSKKEKKIITWLSFLIIINLFFLSSYIYFNHTDEFPKKGGSYSEALIGNPQFINSILSQNNNVDDDIVKLVYTGLLKYDEKHQLIPDIASAYEISEDQKTYTFHIKNNIKWHDGEPLIADDILFTIQIIQDPAYNSPLYFNFDGVSLEKIDDYTIKFILNEPYAPFLDNLTIGILPYHIWSNVSTSYFKLAEYNIKPIGTGPFKFDSLTKDKLGNIKSITLSSFENFYGQLPYIQNITFKFYPDFLTAKDALFNKNVQGISKLPKDLRDQTIQTNQFTIYQYELPQYTAMFFNLTKENTWKSTEMRNALHLGINTEKLVQTVLPNYAKSINSEYILQNEITTTNKFDIEKSKELLQKNEWLLKEDGLRYKNEKPLTLTITTVNQFDNNDIALYLQNELKELGINVVLETLPFEEIKERIKQRNYEVLLYGQFLGNDPDPYPFWHSTQRTHPGLNLSMYANKKADELIESARTTLDKEKRNSQYIELQKILSTDLPAIFLYKPIYNYAVENKIKNITGNKIVIPSDRFNNITNWYIKTKKTLKNFNLKNILFN